MSEKEKVTMVAANGEEREYTVNSNANVNGSCYKWLESNDGNVDLGVKVETPVSLDRSDKTGSEFGTFKLRL